MVLFAPPALWVTHTEFNIFNRNWGSNIRSQMLHVWIIYLHQVKNGTCKGKCREIFPTGSIWVSIELYAKCVLCPHELSANHSDIFWAFHLTPFCAGFSKRCVLWGEIFPFQKTRVLVVSPPSLPLGRIPPGESLPWLLEDQISCIFFRSRLGLVSDGWIWEGLKNAWMVIIDCNKTSPKNTQTWWSWVEHFCGRIFCQGNVKIRCTSEMKAPHHLRAPFWRGWRGLKGCN